MLFGELVPKALTLDRAETLAVLVARPIEMVSRVFDMFPLTLEGLSEAVGHLTRGGVRKGPRKVA